MSKQLDDPVAYYSSVAGAFHASYRSDANRSERLKIWKEYLDRFGGGALVAYDLGCGSGILTCELAQRGIETIGIDGAEGMLQIARNVARGKELQNVLFEQHRLPLVDAQLFRKADLVISSSALEYLDDIQVALQCVNNLLRQHGVVIFSVSNQAAVSRKLVRVVHQITGRPRYFKLLRQFMTVETLKSTLDAVGMTYLDHSYFEGGDRFNRLLSVVLPLRMSSNMIIVAARSR